MDRRFATFGLILAATAILLSGCGTGAFQVQMIPRNQDLVETQLKRDSGLFVWDKIAVIDVDGVLLNKRKDGWMRQGENPVSTFLEKLDKAAGDKHVKAVVLRVNSPGGTVAATDMMYQSLIDFKHNTGKPVVTGMLGLACSGAYYLACGSDGIISQPSTVTGSIGTIMQTFSMAGTMDKIGIRAVTIKSGDLKDLASPLHDLREEERQLLEEIVGQFYAQFLAVVKMGRPNIDGDKLEELADGRVFTADQAKREGLIDRIGYVDDAVEWAKQMAGIEKAQTVMYHRPMDAMRNVYGSAMSVGTGGALVNIDLPDWLDFGGTQFLYLWQPGL